MKLILIGPVYPYRGGIAHYTTQLAQALQAEGHACEVISFKRQYPGWLYPGGSDKDPSQTVKQIDAEYLIDSFYPWTWRQTLRVVLEKKPDLVLFQWWTTFWALPFGCLASWLRRGGVPVAYLVHNVLPHEVRPWDRWMAKLALSPADGFIVQTQREIERLLSLLPGARIEISPHPAYTILTSQRVDKMRARQMLGLPESQTMLLFFGIVRPYKGLKYLIEALAILKTSGLNPFLLVAGDFWEARSEYEKQIEALGLSGQVRLDNRYIPDEQAALMFSAADMLVAPYVGGTQSGVAGMAQGFSLPLIVTEQIAAGMAEDMLGLVKVVPPGDADALAEAIQEWMSTPVVGPAEMEGVEDNWWRMVKALTELHEQIVKERSCA